MFQWLANQIRPFTTGHLIEELVPGHGARMARQLQHIDERNKQWHEEKAHELKKARLERELENAEWILRLRKASCRPSSKNCSASASWGQPRPPAETGTPPRRTSSLPRLVPPLSS